jgi:hypothetical protein
MGADNLRLLNSTEDMNLLVSDGALNSIVKYIRPFMHIPMMMQPLGRTKDVFPVSLRKASMTSWLCWRRDAEIRFMCDTYTLTWTLLREKKKDRKAHAAPKSIYTMINIGVNNVPIPK